jgi:hypothetical protein
MCTSTSRLCSTEITAQQRCSATKFITWLSSFLFQHFKKSSSRMPCLAALDDCAYLFGRLVESYNYHQVIKWDDQPQTLCLGMHVLRWYSFSDSCIHLWGNKKWAKVCLADFASPRRALVIAGNVNLHLWKQEMPLKGHYLAIRPQQFVGFQFDPGRLTQGFFGVPTIARGTNLHTFV